MILTKTSFERIKKKLYDNFKKCIMLLIFKL